MRIVLFTDANTPMTAGLIHALLRMSDGDHRLVGIVTASPESFPTKPLAIARTRLLRGVIAVSNRDVPLSSVRDSGINLFRIARRNRIPVFVAPEADPNEPGFIRRLQSELRPDLALSCLSRRRFRRELRQIFQSCVNIHDGLLPNYRGVMATSFSILKGEPVSGLTFHHMQSKIDAGPILLERETAVDSRSTLGSVSREKCRLLVKALPLVLERVVAGDPGRPQTGPENYYSVSDWRALTHLSIPENATSKQIQRRIRAFGVLNLTLEDSLYPVTRICDARPGDRLAFRAADGRCLKPDRFHGLPGFCYRLVLTT